MHANYKLKLIMIMTIGELNRKIEVLEFQEARDSFGGVVGNWIVVGRVWAKIKPGVGSEHFVNNEVQSTQQSTIIIRFYPAMSVEHRIKYIDTIYEVVAVKDIITNHRWTEITVKEITNEELYS